MAQTINNLSQTWNAAGTTFTAIKFNVTDTASAAGSLLMDLQVGGASRFSVGKSGSTRVAFDAGGYSFLAGLPNFERFAVEHAAGQDGRVRIASAGTLNWTNGYATATIDLSLFRDAAQTLAQRNGTNAQTFRLYNTFTDASNYERGKFEWASNVLRIGTEKAGTGTARALEFQTDGTTRLTIGATGQSSFSGIVTFNDYISCLGGIYQKNRTLVDSPASGVITISTNTGGDFNRLQFGGTTSSFPALKRDTVRLQARLADDSAFTNIQGKLTTETAYTAGAPTATGYLVLYDSNGTAYKVPAEAL
jgi:hypothetical protein